MNGRSWAVVAGLLVVVLSGAAGADSIRQTKKNFEDKFRQLEGDLPTPSTYRTASGAPGESYWQQEADYDIDAQLDEAARRITATASITYKNNSPHTLSYLWFQLDQNLFKSDSAGRLTSTQSGDDSLSVNTLRQLQSYEDKPHGYDISYVRDGSGRALNFVINDTMMRVDLPRELRSGASQSIRIGWAYNITDNGLFGGRSGYEQFKDQDAEIFFIAQWFPRLAAYTDYTGWQHKQFLGRGEFTLEFGDYDVSLTVPADHIVASTGVLQNPGQTLSAEQRDRLNRARSADAPVYIVTPEEAEGNQAEGTSATKTWRFTADNVRDFAWASSRKFIWDAMNVDQPEGGDVLAQSFFPLEADPLWSLYSTRAVAHTIDVYSSFSFAYPYPNAISVNTWERGGMEYPMISFNGYRPTVDEKTGERTYSQATKYGLIGVVIHEVGHNYFPMVVNSDERQWTWMDEGINSFLEYLAELLWEEEFPAVRGNANVLDYIPEYMTSFNQVPIMTNSESIPQFGPNAYTKPMAALTILRETVMGRELFDFAFKEYARRWRFKRPTPADFFRTMEDASGVDLDWFWRGWFYSTDHVDLALTSVREYRLSTKDPEVENPLARERNDEEKPEPLTVTRNRESGQTTYMERHPEAGDFYTENDPYVVNNKDRNSYNKFLEDLEPADREAFDRALADDPFIYFVDFENIGGLVMPIPVTLSYEDGSKKEIVIPAEIWRMDNERVTKLFVEDQRVVGFEIDVGHRIGDANPTNNAFPSRVPPSRIDAFRSSQSSAARNQMADALVELKAKGEDTEDEAEAPLEPTN